MTDRPQQGKFKFRNNKRFTKNVVFQNVIEQVHTNSFQRYNNSQQPSQPIIPPPVQLKPQQNIRSSLSPPPFSPPLPPQTIILDNVNYDSFFSQFDDIVRQNPTTPTLGQIPKKPFY